MVCGVCLSFSLPVRESGALLRRSFAKIRSDLFRMVFLKDLHGCNAATLLEVFTESYLAGMTARSSLLSSRYVTYP